jgi:hypothetical protein
MQKKRHSGSVKRKRKKGEGERMWCVNRLEREEKRGTVRTVEGR